MASIWKHPKSRYWVACFTDSDGRQRKRSTKETDRKRAIRLAEQFESAYRRALTETQARQILNTIYEEIHGEPLMSVNTKQFLENWLQQKEGASADTTVQRYRGVIRDFLISLGPEKQKKEIVFIAAKDILRFRESLARRVSVSTVNFSLKVLRVAFGQAWRDGYLQENPAAKIATLKMREDEAARRPFTLSELERILAAAKDEWRGIILFGLYTGQRLGDIVRLSWRSIDLQKAEVRFLTRKTGRRVNLPIAKPLLDFLATSIASDDPIAPVFPNAMRIAQRDGATRSLSNQFRDILSDAGLSVKRSHQKQKEKAGRSGRRKPSELSFHCLRHTATSLLKNAGVSEAVAMDIIGHESKAISRNYTHVDDEAKRAAMDLLPDVT